MARAKAHMPLCDELPSAARPFLMLGGVIAQPTQAKHRTNSHPTNHTQSTTTDGKNPGTKVDKYTTPDD